MAMVSDRQLARRAERTVLFGDALLLTTGLFVASVGIALALQYLIRQLGLPSVLLDVVGSLSTLAGPLAGAVGAWWLHGRRIGLPMVGGFLLGMMATGVVGMIFPLVGSIGPQPQDVLPPSAIALFGVLTVVYLGFVTLVLRDAFRDTRSELPLHRRLDTLRFVSAGLLVALVIAVVFVMVRDPMSEGGEAGIFAVVFAFAAGFMVLGADLLSGFLARRDEEATVT